MPRLALDQNFPTPIVEVLRDYLVEVELASVRDIDSRMSTLDDWELLLAVKHSGWDALVTTDSSMLKLPREMSVLLQTRLTLIVADDAGHDPVKATGVLLAHLPNIIKRWRPDASQLWVLRASHRPSEDPWDRLTKLAEREGKSAKALYEAYRLPPEQLRRSPWR